MGVTEIPEGIPLMVPKCNSYKRYNELLLYPKDKRGMCGLSCSHNTTRSSGLSRIGLNGDTDHEQM